MSLIEARNLHKEVVAPLIAANNSRTRNHTFEHWGVYGRDFFDYLDDFSGVVFPPQLIDRLENSKKPVVIDFCSGPEALIGLFAMIRARDNLGISVGLADTRSFNDKKRDEERNIFHVSGDVLESRTWASVKRILSGQKADLIVESAVGAIADDRIRTLPVDNKLYGLMINRAWNLLSENNGTLLCEVPKGPILDKLGINILEWRKLLKENNIDSKSEISNQKGFISLTKNPSSPTKLPFLNAAA